MGMESNIDKIKAIACRAAEANSFNEIPRERLNNLYYAFLIKQKDFKSVDAIHNDQLTNSIYQN